MRARVFGSVLCVWVASSSAGPLCPDLDRDGVTTCGGDCDDSDAQVAPGVTEACDGRDDDCDGRVDEGYDEDRDGVTWCAGDCDDRNARVHPFARERRDGVDNDCDGRVDELDLP